MLLRNVDNVDIDTFLAPPLILGDGDLIATHLPLPHPAVSSKGPVLEAIATFPQACIPVKVLVPELHSNLIVAKSEKLLPQAIVRLPGPFAGQESDDGVGAGEKLVSVSPDAVFSVGFGHGEGISAQMSDGNE